MDLDDDFASLLDTEPEAVQVSAASALRVEPLDRGATELKVITPGNAAVDLLAWAEQHRDEVEEHLLPGGALLFRGFEVGGVERFESFSRAISSSLLGYEERSTPRSEVAGSVYTSTEYPQEEWIPQHNELSYGNRWPRRIFFHCMVPAETGGITPIADSRKVLAMLDAEVAERFESRGVMYVRNYGEAVGMSWQEAFQTEDREAVEAFCREAGMSVEWRDGGRLRTRVVRPAILDHPATGERVWFNQANVHHISALSPEVRESLATLLAEEDLPFNTFYGDGAPIPAADIEAVEGAYRCATTEFTWQREDILMLDNILVAHGRSPFTGPRRVVVTMA